VAISNPCDVLFGLLGIVPLASDYAALVRCSDDDTAASAELEIDELLATAVVQR
jgi:hypothetical protein